MPSLRQLEERRRTLATLDDEVLIPPDPRVHGGMGHAVQVTSSVRQATAQREAEKGFAPTGGVPDDPGARQRWFVESAARQSAAVEAERLANEKARREQAEADGLARKQREEAAHQKRVEDSLKTMYRLEAATDEERSIVDALMRREGKYGDVIAHQAKLQTLRWTMEG